MTNRELWTLIHGMVLGSLIADDHPDRHPGRRHAAGGAVRRLLLGTFPIFFQLFAAE